MLRLQNLGGQMSIVTAEELQKIVELANSVPNEYRQKCFELLLGNALLLKQSVTPNTPLGQVATELPPHPKNQQPFILPIDVRAFLSQYGLNETMLWKFFLRDGEEIRPIYQLRVTKKGTAQIQHALMQTLENAIIKGQFQIEIEALRTRCIDQKCYDQSNFTNNLKNNTKLFKSLDTDQPLSLSPDGKSELAELLEQLQGQNGEE
jgi:hypothetical protein